MIPQAQFTDDELHAIVQMAAIAASRRSHPERVTDYQSFNFAAAAAVRAKAHEVLRARTGRLSPPIRPRTDRRPRHWWGPGPRPKQ